jgi:hypothetical protein
MRGGGIYIRRNKSKGAGPYYQLCESYRMTGVANPRTWVHVHLGVHPTPEDALEAWPDEIAHLRRIGRERQADRLESKLKKLRVLTEAEKLKEE